MWKVLLKAFFIPLGFVASFAASAAGWLDQATFEPSWDTTCQQLGGQRECVKGIPGPVGWVPYPPTHGNGPEVGFVFPGFFTCTRTLLGTDISASASSMLGWYTAQGGTEHWLITGFFQGNTCGVADVSLNFDAAISWRRDYNGGVRCPAGFDQTAGLDHVHDFCARTPVDCCSQAHVGNPIDALAAVKYETEYDFQGAGASGLQLFRSYRSGGFLRPAGEDLTQQVRNLGGFWRHNYQRRVILDPGLMVANVIGANGVSVTFTKSGTTWSPLSHRRESLTELRSGGVLTGWLFRTTDGGLEQYDANGNLTVRSEASGTRQSLTYTDGTASGPNGATALDAAVPVPAGLLRRVADDFGRSLTFDYVSTGVLTRVTLPDGSVLTYAFDNGSRLIGVTFPDNSTRGYVYQTAASPLLAGVVDENQARMSTYQYDSLDRPVSTEHAGGVNKYVVTYPASPLGSVSATEPLLLQRSWAVQVINGVARVAGESRPCSTPNCTGTVSKSVVYDTGGTVSEERDFLGNGSCRVNDPIRKLELARVEGLASSDACSAYTPPNATLRPGLRKIVTQWHPDLELQINRAEPGRITTLVYNGQPDPSNGGLTAACAPAGAVLPDGKPIAVLCKKIETPTTDTDGHLGFGASIDAGTPSRVSSNTFNQYGQLLVATDPRGGATTYVYYPDATADHSVGDLQSMTNAVGHVQRFSKYDASGRVLQSIAPTGATMDTTYEPRGWVNTVTVTPTDGSAAQVSGYGYDASGQLKVATLPDGTSVTYSYDDAHRLVGMSDAAGNTTSYTLDNSGNRTKEEVRDASGVLFRTVIRVFDSLGQLRQVTGATN